MINNSIRCIPITSKKKEVDQHYALLYALVGALSASHLEEA